MESNPLDIIVIGAGLSGIAASKFYLDVHPHCNLLILEADTCIGGSWNRRRLYKDFRTQTGLDLAEFSDMPMQTLPPEELHNHMFDAKYITQYLEQYTEKHVYADRSIADRVLFNFAVTNVLKEGDQWIIHGTKDGRKEVCFFRTSKVMVANGLTSSPNMPQLRNREIFGGLILHQKDFGSSNILESSLKHVTVLGGSKSAADMVYSCVKAGKSVTWLIRESGSGPAAFVSSEGKGRYRNSAEAGSTRILGTFSPSPFLPSNGWTRFLHSTRLGQKVVNAFWGFTDKNVRAFGDFDNRSEKLKGFEKLKTKTNIFWVNDNVGIVQHPDFWDAVAKNVQVERDDILELDKGIIRLTNGIEIHTEALLCGTGWLRYHGFFSEAERRRLGLPHTPDKYLDDKSWEELEKTADDAVLTQFPMLRSPPPHTQPDRTLTPYRLYNGIAPLNDDTIVFLGYVRVPNAFRSAEYQALWAMVYLDKKMPNPPSESQMRDEIAFQTAWCRRRYLNNGRLGNYIYYDLIWYTDKLMRELGLEERRKGWWDYWFAPCVAADKKEAREVLRERLSAEQ